MNEIPWGQIGAFGSFAIVIVALVLYFVFKSRRTRNNPGTINRPSCINNPRLQTGLTDIAITKESMMEMKQDMKSLTERTVEQTGILRGVLSEAEKQTRALEKVCIRIGRK